LKLLVGALGALPPQTKIFQDAAQKFRTAWDEILLALEIGPSFGLLPGGIRGGAAAHAFRRRTITTDLQWGMRVKTQQTLSHYLQEAAALEVLPRLSSDARSRIRAAAAMCQAISR